MACRGSLGWVGWWRVAWLWCLGCRVVEMVGIVEFVGCGMVEMLVGVGF